MNISTGDTSPYRNYENPTKRQKLSNNFHPIFHPVEINEKNQSFTFVKENYTILLCRNKKWQEVYYRCHQFPFECMPVSSGELSGSINIYNDTALGLACRNYNKNGLYNQGVTEYEMLELIKSLYMACKIQIRCGQGQLGFTPLMDAVANPNASLELIKFLIDADLALGEGSEMSLIRKDMNGLSPLEHLINSVHRSHDSGKLALEAIRYIVNRSPLITKYINGYRSVSPLILLLSHKMKPLSSYVEEDNDEDSHLEIDRLDRVTECVQILLEGNPDMIHLNSVMSKCTPLHVAFRNNYGDHVDLIKLLLSQDPQGRQVRLRNRFGDLPIHVAVSVGASQETLNVLLQHTLLTSPDRAISSKDKVQAVRQPNPAIWAQSSNGLTPIHIFWMRHVDGKISYPLTTSISQAPSRLATRRNSKYLESLSESVEEIKTLIKKLPSNHTVHDREDIAKQVLGTFWDFLVHYLRCLHLNGDTFYNDYPRNVRKDDFYMLHAVSSLPHNLPGPKLPLTFFSIALMIYPNQITVKDNYGRTALHYASASALMNKSGLDANNVDQSSSQQPYGWDDEDFSKSSISAPIIEVYEAKTKDKFEGNASKIDILRKLYPEAALSYDKKMFLPLHLVVESEKRSREVRSHTEKGADTEWSKNVHKMILANPDSLDKRDPIYGCFPFLQAAISPSSSIDTIYHILRMSPSLVDTGIP